MPKLVFHTLHIVMRDFSDSMEEELRTYCAETKAWHGLSLVHDINPIRNGNGILVVFRDLDKNNDLRERMRIKMDEITNLRTHILRLGFWPETTSAAIKNRGINDPKVMAEEIICPKRTSVAA